MLTKIKALLSKGIWQILAMLLVMVIAGPELLLGMELMALIEVLGASTFVLMYLSGIKLLLNKAMTKFQQFEQYSIWFIPSYQSLKQMPELVLHVIPERTLMMSLASIVTLGMSIMYINLLVNI